MPDFQIKIDRGKKHIRDLDAEITAFLATHPYDSIVQDDPASGEWVFLAVVREAFPAHWAAIAGDAIHNLRTSLNALWRILVPRVWKGDFPIYPSAADFADSQGRLQELAGRAVMNVLTPINPHKGGNDLLWDLHWHDNEEKHRALLTVTCAVPGMQYDPAAALRQIYLRRTGHPVPAERIARQFNQPVYPVQNNTVLFRTPINPDGPQVDLNPRFTFEIAFEEGEVTKGQPVISTLNRFANEVDGIVDDFVRAGLI